MKRIFDPDSKVIANADRVIELLENENPPPVLVEIDPSDICSHHCAFCLSSHIHFDEFKNSETYSRAIMSRDTLLDLCKDLIDMKVRAINFTGGGEPTMNKNLGKAVEYIGENSSIDMGIFTNGSLLHKNNIANILANYLSWIRISIDASNEKMYNEIRGLNKENGWERTLANLELLLNARDISGYNPDIGLGYVITPDNYRGIVEFAKFFDNYAIDYVQYKPEIITPERNNEFQRNVDFWMKEVGPLLAEAKDILDDRFMINGYKLSDLKNDTEKFGRNYKKCFGSQIQPCVGASGEVYVCPNLRGYKKYSYGNINDSSFKSIWSCINKKQEIMKVIEEEEKFSNCMQLCKCHQSNKKIWEIYQDLTYPCDKKGYYIELLKEAISIRSELTHPNSI